MTGPFLERQVSGVLDCGGLAGKRHCPQRMNKGPFAPDYKAGVAGEQALILCDKTASSGGLLKCRGEVFFIAQRRFWGLSGFPPGSRAHR